jgi:hypothetical protein
MPNRSFSYRGVLAYLSASRCVPCFDSGDSHHRLFSGDKQDMEIQREYGIIRCLDRPVFSSVHFTTFEQRRLGHHLFIESYNFDFVPIGVDGQSRTVPKKTNKKGFPIMIDGIEKDGMERKYIYSDIGVKVFIDFKDNLIVDSDDPIIARQARNWRYGRGIVKGLSYLGSEDSEDAMTWNVFKTLEKSNPEQWFSKIFPQIILDKGEQFIAPMLRFWDKYFPPLLRPFPEGETHVDLTMETSKKLIFVEVKYKADISKNTTHDPNRDQIIRNIDVGSWAAKKRAKEFYFVLLTLKTNTYSIDKFHDYKSNPLNIIEKIGSYRKDIKDYVTLCEHIHVMYWDQILTSLQNIQLANKTGLNYTDLIDYLKDKLS